MEKNLLGMPSIKHEGQVVSTNCLEECQGIAMRAEIERLRIIVRTLNQFVSDADYGYLPVKIRLAIESIEEKE